jgi:glycosyltransferase involved in cell wall biosynthesis
VRPGILNTFLHWILVGVFRGQRYFPKLRLSAGDGFIGLKVAEERTTATNPPIKINEVDVEDITLERELEIPRSVILQIEELAKLEPMLFAPGRKTLGNLRVINTIDTLATTGIAISEIDKISQMPQTLILVPHFVIGGADHYTANLVSIINREGGGPVLVIATSPEAEFNNEELSLEMVQAYAAVEIALWKDIATNRSNDPRTLALFINALSPKRLVIVQSDLAFRTLENYGLPLSSRIQIFCAYFSMDNSVFSYQYGIRYFRTVADYSSSFSDNEITLQNLKRLNPFANVREIPTVIGFGRDNSASSKNWKRRNSPVQPRYIWLSRLEEEKGTAVLSRLADLLPDSKFDVFGPMQGKSLAELGLEKQNISYLGVIPSISQLSLDDYDGFVFTSLSEGNPITVLEMAALGIPIVSTKVGSLEKVFSEEEIHFVDCSTPIGKMAESFAQKLSTLRNLPEGTVNSRVSRTQKIVLETHSESAVSEIVREFFEIKG